MMARCLILFASAMTFSWGFASDSGTFRDALIAEFPIDEVNAHTCSRVEEMGRDTVSRAECLERVDKANSDCRELAPKYVPDTPRQEDIEILGAIVMACPVAKVLEISFTIQDGKANVGWSELTKKE